MFTYQLTKSFSYHHYDANQAMLVVGGLSLNLPTALAVSIFGECPHQRCITIFDHISSLGEVALCGAAYSRHRECGDRDG
jgi:hypothetical protein